MINQILSLESQALKLCEQRATILARNLANASTPNYQSRDINFAEAFKQATNHHKIQISNPNHIPIHGQNGAPKQYYRVPMQVSLDNNTVDDELERKSFSKNAIHYQAALNLAQTQMSTLMHAIKGE